MTGEYLARMGPMVVHGGLLAWATMASGTGRLTTFGIGPLGAVLALAVQRGGVWRPAPFRS